MNTGYQKKVAVFGGSFNPPHIGHVAICEWLMAKGLADEVWVVPCFIHPFGKDLASFNDRYNMCLFAFKKMGKSVNVSKVEHMMRGVSHTVRTIEHFQGSNPGCSFSLVTGEDIKTQSSKWHEFDKIKTLVPIISVPRGKDSPIPDVSATDIRARIAQGQSFVKLVPKEVAVYIVTHRLYRSS